MTPIRRTTIVIPTTTEVGAAAAEPCLALLVNDWPARLTFPRFTSCITGLSRFAHRIALAEASLTPITAVESLVLDVVLGTTVASAGAATVEEAICASARAGDATLGVATSIDLGNSGGEGGCGRDGL